jgi:hypothetical protein
MGQRMLGLGSFCLGCCVQRKQRNIRAIEKEIIVVRDMSRAAAANDLLKTSSEGRHYCNNGNI